MQWGLEGVSGAVGACMRNFDPICQETEDRRDGRADEWELVRYMFRVVVTRVNAGAPKGGISCILRVAGSNGGSE